MKHKLLRILPFLLLGGVLGLAAAPAAFEATGVKAEDVETKQVKFTSSKVKAAMSNAYGNPSFTIDNVSFASKNICYQGSSGSEYLQIKASTNNGFWSTTTFEDFYISAISMTVSSNACSLGLSATTTFSSSTSVTTGSFSSEYTQTQGYKYIKIMSGGSLSQIKNLTITFTKNSDQPLPPFEGDYALVEDASELQSGDKIVLGNAAKGTVAGVFGLNQYFSSTQGTFRDGELTPTSPDVITLLATDGGWNLYTQAEGYIGCSESGKLAANTKDTWTISIAEGGAATIDNGTYKIKYNVNSPRFSCYSGEPTESMPLPEIYKSKSGETDTFKVTYNGNGAEGSTTDSNEYPIGSEVTVLASSFSKPVGKVFANWNTKADGTGDSYYPDEKFTILKNTELFAIWEDEYIPVGDSFTKVTSASELSSVSSFLFVYQSGSTVKANGGLEGGDYFKAYDAKIIDNELTYSNEKIVPLSLEKDGSEWLIKSGSSYLALTANSSNKLAFKEKAKANRWSISFADGKAKVTSTVESVSHSIYYNASGVGRFSNYSSTSQNAIEMWAKTGHAKEVHLNTDELDINLGFTGHLYVEECIGFEPTTYLWEVTSGSDIVSITNGQGTDEIELTPIKEGQAEVTVTVDGVKAKAIVNVHDFKYDLLDKDNYYILKNGMFGTDLSNIPEPDFGQTDQMWHFEKNYLGDNAYWLMAGSKYLTFGRDVDSSTTASELVLTDDAVNSWQITKNDTKYKVATVNANGKTVSLSQSGKLEWFAFEGNNYVELLQGGTFDHYAVEALPTTKQYFVGDALKPLNSHIYAYYTNGYKSEITNKITWKPLTVGTKAYGTCVILGEEIDIEMDGLQIYQGDPFSFKISGVHSSYVVGEKINKKDLTIELTYKLDGFEDIKKTLNDKDYTISPERVEATTESFRIALTNDPTVWKDVIINVREVTYIAAGHIDVGDSVVLGTLGYSTSEITGGKEFTYSDGEFGSEDFGYMPAGSQSFKVGKSGSYYTLKNEQNGLYLRGDNSTFKAYAADKKYEIYTDKDNKYNVTMDVKFDSSSTVYKVTMSTFPNVSLDDCLEDKFFAGYSEDHMVYGYSNLLNDEFVFELYDSSLELVDMTSIEVDWDVQGGAFIYTIPGSGEDVLNDECLWSIEFDDVNEEWVLSNKLYSGKQCYCNDGKFAFYTKGSSYTPLMIFRDNTINYSTSISNVTVSLNEGFETTTVGEPFNWISALDVLVKFSGETGKHMPIGSYQVELPDTSKVGTAQGKVIFGVKGHEIEKTFNVFVKGKTQAFDVVCPDPIRVGETLQAHLADHYEPPEGEPITWSVSDPTLASIDQDGNVTGLKAGYVDVIATSFDGTYSDFEHVRIFQNVESLTLDKTEITLEAGTKQTIVATVKPDDASNPTVIWDSNNKDVVSVNSKGEITGLSEGKATITCTTQGKPLDADEPLTATCEVTVTPGSVVRVKGVTLDCDYKELRPGDTFQLNAIINPSNATEQGVTWESNAPQLADVSKTGKVTVKNGAATGKTIYITCTTLDGGFTARCEIKTVSKIDPVPVKSVTLNTTSKKIAVNEVFDLIAEVLPGNADTKQVTFASSNDLVASVDQYASNAAKIKGLKDGVATITARCGGKEATCKVIVGDGTVSVTSVSLNETSVELFENETKSLTATVNPTDATNKNVTWSSSDTNIVTVDSSGKITAVKEGTATITVTTADGGKTATCSVTVKKGSSPTSDENTVAIIIGTACGVGAVGIGCGVGIPLGIRAHKKRRLIK